MSVPTIEADPLVCFAKRMFPTSKVAQEPINPEYRSWRITVGGKEEDRWLEITWGPLSGFGGTDVRNLPRDDPDIFAPFEVAFGSSEEAMRWLEIKSKTPNQSPEATPGLRPS